MFKKDFTMWQISDDFPMELLREKFNQMIPFNHNNEEPSIHASNRLFGMAITQAVTNGMVGRNGLPSIRYDMTMDELLYDILSYAHSIQLLPSDIEYYLHPISPHSLPLNSDIIASIVQFQMPQLTWVINDDINPTQMVCRLIGSYSHQDMFIVPVQKNKDNCYELII